MPLTLKKVNPQKKYDQKFYKAVFTDYNQQKKYEYFCNQGYLGRTAKCMVKKLIKEGKI